MIPTYEEIKDWAFSDAPELEGDFSQEKRNLAEDALRFGYEWCTMQPVESLMSRNRHEYINNRQECKKYIKEKILSNKESSGFILINFLFVAVLNAVIGWVIRKLLDNWFIDGKHQTFKNDMDGYG